MTKPTKERFVTTDEFTDLSAGPAASDCVLQYMLKHKIPLTQQRYLMLAYWDDRKLEDLGAEERSMLPEGFEDWPRTEKEIN
jgi:hypothetical protein